MPTYTYYCSKCDNRFEIFANIGNYKQCYECPKCNDISDVTRALGYDISTVHREVIANDDNITLGQLADRNTKKMSRDEKINRYYEQNKYKWEGQESNLPKGARKVRKDDKDSIIKRLEKRF